MRRLTPSTGNVFLFSLRLPERFCDLSSLQSRRTGG